ncbi:phage portal protein [Rhodococcus sp. IEGM 1379]|uniref:phage portal protein n=1 Tax=Rhodococcus sp. IEGM 1379 TaxID=3047086 RepID=UPI0024B73AC8|nr:phage portal protein [Rhodococcus sp. IEGM 1379]MDI9916903.1 phage portal protein [Rhodococcus sp. IEGM 1379]
MNLEDNLVEYNLENDLALAVQTILDRQQEYEKAEKYYKGEVDEVFASPSVRRALSKIGSDFRINFAAMPVDAVAARLEIDAVKSVSADGADVLDAVFEDAELELELKRTFKNALMFGDAYMFVWPDSSGSVQAYYNSPKSTVVLYDPENPRVAAVAAKVWVVPVAGETRHRVNLYYADAIYKFISTAQRLPMTVQATDFAPYLDADTDEAGYVQNPYGQIPIFHVATDRPFGTPEHKAAYGPQDIINKLVITQMASVEHYGFPTRYVLSENHANVANDFDDDDDSADLSGNPGDLWMLTNTKQVGQFDAAKPDTYLAPYKEYIRTMASVTSTPLHYFENTQTNVSGEALRASEAALIKKVRDRQLSFGTAIRSMFVFILKLHGIKSDVQLHWVQPESIDDKERWEVAYKKVQAGLPVKQMLIEQGYDTQIVESWDLPVLNPQTNQLEQNTENEGDLAA